MTLKEMGNVKHIEFNSEEERKKYIDWLEYIHTEYYVLSDGVSYGDNGTVWFLNIVEQLLEAPQYLTQRDGCEVQNEMSKV